MSLIDKLLDGAEEVVEKAKRPFVKKKIKRSVDSAIENAEEQKVDASIELQDLRERLVKEPTNAASILNAIIDRRTTIDAADETIKALEAEKDELFK